MTLREEEAAESRVARVMADRRLVGLPCASLLLGAAQRILPDQSRADNVIQKKGHLGITEENRSSRFLSKFTMSTPQQSVGTGTAHQAPRWWVLGSTGNTPSVYSCSQTGRESQVKVWCLQKELTAQEPVAGRFPARYTGICCVGPLKSFHAFSYSVCLPLLVSAPLCGTFVPPRNGLKGCL